MNKQYDFYIDFQPTPKKNVGHLRVICVEQIMQ